MTNNDRTPQPLPGERLLTILEASRRYKICRSSLYKLFGAGLQTVKIGRSRRIPVDALEAYVRERAK